MTNNNEIKADIASKIKELELYKEYVKTRYQQDYWLVKFEGMYSMMTLNIKTDLAPNLPDTIIKAYLELIDREIDKLNCEYANIK